MKLVCISDTHGYHRKIVLPEGDVLIGCGDYTGRGELSIMEDFANWMKEQPHKHKICIFGNHDIFEYGERRRRALEMFANAGVSYLENESIIINDIIFFGSPMTPTFGYGWAFNRDRGKDIIAEWRKIPNDCGVLITHGPPYGILDAAPRGVMSFENVGCKDLLDRILELRHLKVHCFGHIHRDADEAPIKDYGITFVNASICNNAYRPVNNPVVIDI